VNNINNNRNKNFRNCRIRYSFGIINWKLQEVQKIAWITRKMLRMSKMNHPKNDTDRRYIKRREGGGL
jgi:hypothetical protein